MICRTSAPKRASTNIKRGWYEEDKFVVELIQGGRGSNDEMLVMVAKEVES